MLLETPSPYNTIAMGGGGLVLSKELLSQKEYITFLDHLLSTPLSALPAEPANLASRHAQLSSQLAELAYLDYPAILSASEATKSVGNTLQGITAALDRLPNTLDSISSSIGDFLEKCPGLTAQRERAGLVLDHLPMLLDLLEAPQLLQTLARNGHYDEALDLQQHVERIRLRAPDSKVVRQIAEEVSTLSQTTILQLLDTFRHPTPLATSIRLVGHLRRSSALPEHALRSAWLAGRWHRFAERVDEEHEPRDEQGAVNAVRRYVDVARDEIMDTVAQYRAIFPDSGAAVAPIHSTSTSATLPAILPSFLTLFTSHFLTHLQQHLPIISDISHLASLYTHAAYLGVSLARVGCDLRTITGALWEARVGEVVERNIRSGARVLVEAIDRDGPEFLLPRGSATSTPNAEEYPLPTALHNLFFGLYNHLRHLAFISLAPHVASAVSAALEDVASAVNRCGAVIPGGSSPHEREIRTAFTETVSALENVVLVKVVDGLEKGVFGSVGGAIEIQMDPSFPELVKSSNHSLAGETPYDLSPYLATSPGVSPETRHNLTAEHTNSREPDLLLQKLADLDRATTDELLQTRKKIFEEVIPSVCSPELSSTFQGFPEALSLEEDGPLRTAKMTGDVAPNFKLTSVRGAVFSLNEELARVPYVMMNFWRGNWCPFCQIQIKSVEKALKDVRSEGCTVLFISPQNAEKTKELDRGNSRLVFLPDPKLAICNLYRVGFWVGLRFPELAEGNIVDETTH
ncbi:hypothetical protein HDU93_004338 [Gonapodya sp. JEL0774]|nr:hypothetical protein HDU93_004338 [Gonapodya sp. JEL0774]